jgi:hypothetical protein
VVESMVQVLLALYKCGDSLFNMVMSPVGHKEQTGDDRLDGECLRDRGYRGPQAALTRSGAEQC